MNAVRPAFAFTAVVFRGLTRDTTALFFTLVMPVIVIVIIGSTFGGVPRIEVGIVREDPGALAGIVVEAIQAAEGASVREYETADELRQAVRRFTVAIGVIIPEGFDQAARETGGAEVGLVTSPSEESAFASRLTLQGILDAVAARLGAARFGVAETGAAFEEALSVARDAAAGATTVVELEDVGEPREEDLSSFSLVAPQNLVLFVFINSMAAAALIVRSRREGILRRALATRTSMATILAGLGLGWLAFALAQSLIVLGVGALAFGVRWGDPAAATLLVLVFAIVGCGAGLLVGAVGRDEDRVGSITPVLGIVLGALGGCMVPIEVFPPVMRSIAHAVPHFWAVQGWQSLVFDGEGPAGIAGSLGVLLAFATVMLVAATAILRRDLSGG